MADAGEALLVKSVGAAAACVFGTHRHAMGYYTQQQQQPPPPPLTRLTAPGGGRDPYGEPLFVGEVMMVCAGCVCCAGGGLNIGSLNRIVLIQDDTGGESDTMPQGMNGARGSRAPHTCARPHHVAALAPVLTDCQLSLIEHTVNTMRHVQQQDCSRLVANKATGGFTFAGGTSMKRKDVWTPTDSLPGSCAAGFGFGGKRLRVTT